MDVFFELPFELTRYLADNWLSVADLVALDTAYCHKAKREQWGKLICTTGQFQNYEVIGAKFGAYQSWLFARRIKTTKLVFLGKVNYELSSGYLQDMGGYIKEVIIKNKADESEMQAISALVERHCNNLTNLICSSCVLDPVLVNLLHKSSLQHLRIQNCTDLETELNDLACWEGSYHIQLRSVELCCRRSKWFFHLLLKLVDPFVLQQFHVLIDDTLPSAPLIAFFRLCCNLRALSFHGSRYFSNEHFLMLIELCPNLLHLDISGCIYLTDDIAVAFPQNMTSLCTLNISQTELTNVLLEALVVHCSHSLQALYADGCDEMDDIGVLSHCPQLRTLQCMSECLGNAEGLINITTLFLWDEIRDAPLWTGGHCAKLKHLHCEFYDTGASEVDFTQMTVQVLPRLRTLSVCCEEEEEEPESLRALRAARPKLRVNYNAEVWTYDLFKLPL